MARSASHRRIWFLAVLLAAGSVAAQPSSPRPSIQARRRTTPVQVDGNLREWNGYPAIQLRERAQLDTRQGAAEATSWAGPEDLSGEIFLAWTPTELILAGRIVDQEVVPPAEGKAPWEGDAVEVFLDLDLADDLAVPPDKPCLPNSDDIQLFLLPRNPSRPWGVISYEGGLAGTGARLVDRGWSGVQVAFQELRDGFTFELQIPFHNLRGLRPGAGEIGFNVALGDHDPPAVKYSYLVWTGDTSPYADTRRRGRLRFEPGVILVGQARPGPDLGATLLAVLEAMLFPLLLLAALGVAFQVEHHLLGGRRGWRWAAAGAAVLLVAGGAFLPGLLGRWRQAGNRSRLRAAAERVEKLVQTVSIGPLGSYRGRRRDGPLLDLLAGRPVKRVPGYVHEPVDLGPEPVQFPEGHLVKLYGIPLEPGEGGAGRGPGAPAPGPLEASFREPIQKGLLIFSFTYAGTGRQIFGLSAPRVAVRLLPPPVPGAAEAPAPGPAERLLDLGQPAPMREDELLGGKGESGRLAVAKELPVPEEGVQAIEVRHAAGEGIRLEGVTWLPPDDLGEGRPLALGKTTLSGVPTNLFGPHPRRAGALLPPGREMTWKIPSSGYQRSWDRVWLILSALPEKGALARVAYKEPAAVVRFGLAGEGREPLTWELLHQYHLFSERAEENDRLEELERGEAGAEVAFRWSPEDSPQERRLSVAASRDLPPGAEIQTLTVANTGPYPIHVWDLVLGIQKVLRPGEQEGSPLRTTPEGDSVELKEEARDLLRGFYFAIYRDGLLQPGCTLPGAPAGGVRLGRLGQRSLSEPSIQVGGSQLQPEPSFSEAFVPLQGEAWGNAVLAVVMEDPGLVGFQRVTYLLGLVVVALSVPFLFVLVTEWLLGLHTLRAKLVGSLALAAAVPLVLFSIFLVRVLESGHREREHARLMEQLRSVMSYLDRQLAGLQEDAANRFNAVLQSIREQFPPAPDGKPPDRIGLARVAAGELAKQRPAEWSAESFLRIDLAGPPGSGPPEAPLVVYDREESRFLGEAVAPIRGGSFQLRWGIPFLSLRVVDAPPGGPGRRGAANSLTMGLPLDTRFLSRVAGRHAVVLYDAEGYPLIWTGGSGEGAPAAAELSRERDQAAMEEKREIITRLMEGKSVAKLLGDGEKVGAFSAISDSADPPRPVLLLGVLERSRQAGLSLAFLGEVGVARFFGATGSAILALVLFVGWLVTDRVSRPLERLREGTGRISMGELDVRIAVAGRDEIGELAGAFNGMAGQLQARIRDTERLNQALRDFTKRLDMAEVGQAACSFLAGMVAPARVVVAVADREDEPLVVDSLKAEPFRFPCAQSPLLQRALAMDRMSLLPDPPPRGPLIQEGDKVLVVPLRLGERVLGSLILIGEGALPEVNPHFMETLAGQMAVALENARLFRLAVEDPQTGAFVSTYFRERLTREVDLSRRSGRPLALVRLSLDNLDKLAERLGPLTAGRATTQVAKQVKAALERPFLLGWLGRSDYEILFPETTRETAVQVAHALREKLEATPLDVGSGDGWYLKVSLGVAGCPEDAESAEFLVAEAERLLVRARRREAVREGLAETALPGQRVFSPVVRVAGQDLVVKSDEMQSLLRTVERIASTNLTVLLLGETGAGKEVFADLIHHLSDRAEHPLVKVNCAAFPEALLESELFGHERGAFTGAVARKRGRFELAEGGTLFLDEVGEMSLATQVKLLRFLQDHRIERLGTSETRQVDVRVVAATNRNLERAIEEGRFREDLYFRLKVVTLEIPSLRERKEDIPHLVEAFRQRFVEETGKPLAGISAEAMDLLYRHSWPGNVRELRNVLSRAMYLAAGEIVEARDLILPESRVEAVSAPAPPNPAALPPRLARLYRLLQERRRLTAKEYVEIAGVPRRTGLRNLTELTALGYARREGGKRKGAYFVPLSLPPAGSQAAAQEPDLG